MAQYEYEIIEIKIPLGSYHRDWTDIEFLDIHKIDYAKKYLRYIHKLSTQRLNKLKYSLETPEYIILSTKPIT